MKLLTVKIADGRSPETLVAERLLAQNSDIETVTLYHQVERDAAETDTFRRATMTRVLGLDFGWRPFCRQPGNRLRKALAWLRFWTVAMPAAIRIAHREVPDVVVSSQQKWDCLAAWILVLASFGKRRQVVHLHYVPGPWLGRVALRRLRQSDLVICVSDFIAREAIALGCHPDRTVTIHNPVDPIGTIGPEQKAAIREHFGIPDEVVAVLMAARIDAGKGQIDALEAFARAHLTNARLYFLGDGPDRDLLSSRIGELGLSGRVSMLGYHRDARSFFGAFDIFIHPSLHEPFGLAVAEASASGLPVIAYDSGAAPELVQHNVTGFLASTGDVAQLANFLQLLAQDSALRSRLGNNGRLRMARRFSPENQGKKFWLALAGLTTARPSDTVAGVP
jgi:glycosyltransferase involved in cell wall biosynthesis